MTCVVRTLAGTAAVCLAAVSAPAGQTLPWDGPGFSAQPEAIAAAARKLVPPEDADLEFLLKDTVVRFDAEGRAHRTTRVVYRCLTRQGVEEHATVEAAWDPWYEERPTIRARVVTPEGTAHTLDPASIGEVPVDQDSDVLSDRRRLRAPLPALGRGAVVESETVARQREPFFAAGTLERFLLGTFVPARRIRVTLDYPRTLPLRYEVRGVALEPERSEGGDRVRLAFELAPEEPVSWPEPLLPPEMPRWPEMVCSTGASWSDVAKRYAEVVDRQIDLDAVRPLVRAEIGDEKDRRAIAAKLLAAVRRLVRFTGVEFGEAAIVPGKPSETLARRYGDCKDQATLLVAMLRAAGVPAHVALVQTGFLGGDVLPGLPALNAFDHAIVHVRGEPPLWIDPTAEYVPCGEVPVSLGGRLALVADASTESLVRLPRSKSARSTFTNRFEFDLRNGPTTVVREELLATGPAAWTLRGSYASGTRRDLEKGWKDYGRSTYLSDDLKEFQYAPLEDLDAPFTVKAEIAGAVVPQRAEVDHELSVVLHLGALLDNVPYALTAVPTAPEEAAEADRPENEDEGGEKPQRRKHPLWIAEPHVARAEYVIHPPVGFAAEALPKSGTQRWGPATFSQQFEQAKDGSVRAVFQFDTGPGRLTADEVEEFRQAAAKVMPDGNRGAWHVEVPLVHRALLRLAEGRVREAVQEHQRTLERFPQNVDERRRYAGTLCEAGLGAVARAQARQAVELDPKRAISHADLGRILVCDELGVLFGRTMDWDGAAAAYRKALQLDPSDVLARLDYAILLEYSPTGIRYDPRHLEESAREYRRAFEQSELTEQMRVNLFLVLLYLGRYEEIAEVPVNGESTALLKALCVAALAGKGKPDEALRAAARLSEGAEERHSLIETAAYELARAREYDKAEALSENFRGLKHWEAQDAPDSEPERLAVHVLAHLLAGDEFSEVRPWFVEGTTAEDVRESHDLYKFWDGAEVRAARSAGTPPWRTADLVTLLEFESRGDRRTGLRLRAEQGRFRECTCYVLPANGAFRLIAPGRELSGLGGVALDWLDREKPRPARQWLDWAYQEHRHDVGWFDTFSGTPFGRIWWTCDRAKPEQLRIAAAALAAESARPKRAIPILREARKRKDLDENLALQVDRALMEACLRAGDFAGLLEAADRILDVRPGRDDARTARIEALTGLKRLDEAMKMIREDLDSKELADSSRVQRAVAAARCGEFELAQEWLVAVFPGGGFLPDLRNELAWNAVFLGEVDRAAIQHGEKATETFSFPSFLHTLATVYAEADKPVEAIAALRRRFDRNGGRPEGVDWYVLGRVAECYGLEDAAVAYYTKVPKEETHHANATWHLARRRLKALGAQ